MSRVERLANWREDRERRKAEAEERAARAERIQRLWEEEGLDGIVQTWEDALYEALLKTDASQDTERYRLQTAIVMGRKFRDRLLGIVRDGDLAKKELERIQTGKREFH